MYVILISSYYVLNVHRTTYKRLNSYLIIEKNTLLFDAGTKSIFALYTPTNIIPKYSHGLSHHKSWPFHHLSIGIGTLTNFKMLWSFVKYFTYCGSRR